MKVALKICFIILLGFIQISVQGQSTAYNYSGDLNLRFLEAASNGDFDIVNECIKKGVNVNITNWDGVTALMYATASGNARIVKLLLEKGAYVNAQPYYGPHALITASQYGFTEIAEILLSDSAKTDLTDNNQATALHYASLYNNDTIVYMLLQAGANPDIRAKEDMTPLAMASINGSYESAYLLIDAGADVNSKDKTGYTPLMIACQTGVMHLIKLLLSSGAEVNIQNSSGFSALSLAILNKHPEVVKILLENGANPKEINTISLNPRSLAKLSGDSAVISEIKKTGVKSNLIPDFKSGGFSFDLNLSSGSLLTGISLTQTDHKFNLVYNLGFSFQPMTVKIDYEIPDFGSYQFKERRYMFNFDLGKNFKLQKEDKAGIHLGGRILYSFGKYRATNIQINGGLALAPQTWIYFNNKNVQFRLGYHYSNYGEKDLNASHFTISVIPHIYKLKVSDYNRRISWID